MKWSKKVLGSNLRRIRMELGKSQVDFAYEAELTPNALAKMECGLSTPQHRDHLQDLQHLGDRTNDLFRTGKE